MLHICKNKICEQIKETNIELQLGIIFFPKHYIYMIVL